jgi:predicted nucleic acid-binding protein
MIHLDTSFLIRALVQGSQEGGLLDGWIASGEDVAISAIAWTEFLCGPVDAAGIAAAGLAIGTAVPLLAEDSAVAAHLYNRSGRRRGSLADCMIAAIALRQGAILATSNIDDFRRFGAEGLRLIELS